MQRLIALAAALALASPVTALAQDPPEEAEAQAVALDPGFDEFAAGEIFEPPASDDDLPFYNPSQFEGAPNSELYGYPIGVRIAPDLDPQLLSRIVATIETQPGWFLSENPSYELAPHPERRDFMLLAKIKGAAGRGERALNRILHRDGAMSLDEIVQFYGINNRDLSARLSNVPLPINLGRHDAPEFDEILGAQLARTARSAALLAMADFDGDSVLDELDQTAICVSLEMARGGYCPMPPDGGDWGRIDQNAGSHQLAVTSANPEKPYVSVIAIAPDDSIMHLASGRAEHPVYTYIEGGVTRRVIDTNAPAIFQAGHVLPEAEGDYRLIVIASEQPINEAIWSIELGTDPSASICRSELEKALCWAMQGGPVGKTTNWIIEDISSFSLTVLPYPAPDALIIGGFPAPKALALWQAQLFVYRDVDPMEQSTSSPRLNFEKMHKCGGSYIGGGYILTAAHCIRDDISEMRIRLGTRNITGASGRVFEVHSVAVHPRQRDDEARADVAVIRLDDPDDQIALLEGDLAAIRLARKDNQGNLPLLNLLVTGWGYTSAMLPGVRDPVAADGTTQRSPPDLLVLGMTRVPTSVCTDMTQYRNYAAGEFLCIKSKLPDGDACAGDSGGPLTAAEGNRRVLVGIVSAGVGCAYQDLPSVYVNVDAFRPWISAARTVLKNAAPGARIIDDFGTDN